MRAFIRFSLHAYAIMQRNDEFCQQLTVFNCTKLIYEAVRDKTLDYEACTKSEEAAASLVKRGQDLMDMMGTSETAVHEKQVPNACSIHVFVVLSAPRPPPFDRVEEQHIPSNQSPNTFRGCCQKRFLRQGCCQSQSFKLPKALAGILDRGLALAKDIKLRSVEMCGRKTKKPNKDLDMFEPVRPITPSLLQCYEALKVFDRNVSHHWSQDIVVAVGKIESGEHYLREEAASLSLGVVKWWALLKEASSGWGKLCEVDDGQIQADTRQTDRQTKIIIPYSPHLVDLYRRKVTITCRSFQTRRSPTGTDTTKQNKTNTNEVAIFNEDVSDVKEKVWTMRQDIVRHY